MSIDIILERLIRSGYLTTSKEKHQTWIYKNLKTWKSFKVLGWEIHVNPWLIHVNVWQKPLQYCKVITLQLIQINEKKNKVASVKVYRREIKAMVYWYSLSFAACLQGMYVRNVKRSMKTVTFECVCWGHIPKVYKSFFIMTLLLCVNLC